MTLFMTDIDPKTPRPQPVAQPQARMPISLKRMAMPGGVSLQALTIAGVALLAAMIVWNLGLRNDVSDLEDRLASVESENATIRASANATVYQLLPTADAPQNANAQAWFSIQGSGVLSVANLPPLKDGTAYQLWYITDSPTNPVPGGTFTVNDTGQGFMLIPADVDGVTSIAVSVEPEGGSASPTGDILLSSDVSDARG
jgi:Anti-sigma-K factor rskA